MLQWNDRLQLFYGIQCIQERCSTQAMGMFEKLHLHTSPAWVACTGQWTQQQAYQRANKSWSSTHLHAPTWGRTVNTAGNTVPELSYVEVVAGRTVQDLGSFICLLIGLSIHSAPTTSSFAGGKEQGRPCQAWACEHTNATQEMLLCSGPQGWIVCNLNCFTHHVKFLEWMKPLSECVWKCNPVSKELNSTRCKTYFRCF